MTPHRFQTRVYYEDTDLAGIVYYANYLRYIERARTEYVRSLGIDQTRLRDEAGMVFAVLRVEADYLTPARFDENLVVLTEPVELRGARVTLRQDVTRDDTLCFTALVKLGAITLAGRPTRLPAEFRARLQADLD